MAKKKKEKSCGIQRDLNIGAIAENTIISLLQKAGHEAMKNLDKETRQFYDIEVELIDKKTDATLTNFTIEVKNDVYALKSGNIAVEMYNPKSAKNSGLSVTQADLWVFMVGAELWVANTHSLRKFVETNKPFRIIDSGGDNNAYLYLYKKDVIFDAVFQQIDILDSQELTILLEELKRAHE